MLTRPLSVRFSPRFTTIFTINYIILGTLEERGMIRWRAMLSGDQADMETTIYDLPFGMNFIKRTRLFRCLPICPTFAWKSSHEPAPTEELDIELC